MMSDIHIRLKSARKLSGETQKELAEVCNTSQSNIARFESGKFISLKLAERIAEHYGYCVVITLNK